MKPFNLEEYKKNPNRKVVCRDKAPVRIICTDRKDVFPIIALRWNKQLKREDFITCHVNGKYDDTEGPYDLFFVSDHEGWINIYRSLTDNRRVPSEIYSTKKEAQENACTGVLVTTKIEWEE